LKEASRELIQFLGETLVSFARRERRDNERGLEDIKWRRVE
jgi:hypothetical protein